MMGSMMRRAMLGDGSTLNLDFTTGVLDPRLSFTRASTTATYINSSGYVTTAGTNVARFDHDPTTLAPRGLLVEGQATNLLNWSESFATSGGTNNNWADTSITRTTGQADPANGTTAIRFTASAGNATVISSAAIGTSAARTFSVWLRRVTGTGNIQYTQNNGTNWTTQAITSTWTRYSFTHTVDHRVGIRIVTSGDAIEMWGAQLETGSGASSYIPTGASQATRNRDQVTLSNLSSINFSQTEGTCLATVEVREKADSTFLPYGSFNTSGGGRCWLWLRHNLSTSVGTRLLGSASNSGGATALTTANYVYNSGNGGVVKFATSLDTATSSMVYVISGGAPQITTAAAFTLATAAEWGLNTSNDLSATDLRSMWVQSFKYWPTALPNAQLQSLTT
jgi:hypothetical protein